jgi:hypothetical protein
VRDLSTIKARFTAWKQQRRHGVHFLDDYISEEDVEWLITNLESCSETISVMTDEDAMSAIVADQRQQIEDLKGELRCVQEMQEPK